MEFDPFVSCHVHPMSLDSGATPEAFLKRELELKTGAFVCTDHGKLGAAKQIYDLAKKNKLIPIIGLEGYFRDDTCSILSSNPYYVKNDKRAFKNAPKYQHVTLHAMDQKAYECMVTLLSNADARLESVLETLETDDKKHGNERKPLFNWNDLEELGSHNITVTSSCMIGIIKRHLKDNDDIETAIKYFERIKSIFKPGNFYVELNPHDTSHNWVEGVFITTASGEKLRFHQKKKLLTDVGEIVAYDLAKEWGNGAHKILKSVKDRQKWREMPELEMTGVEKIEEFMPNEPCSWAPDGDLDKGLNTAIKILARRYKVPIIIGDDSHYPTSDYRVVQDVRLAQSGAWKFYGDYSRQNSLTAFEHFHKTLGTSEDEFKSWVENSRNWAARFKDFKFETKPSLPTKFYEIEYKKFPWYKEGSKHNSLRYIFELIKKQGRMDWNNSKYVERLETEIKLLHENGTIDLLPYFMTAEEVVDFFAKRRKLTGVGRGSAGALILAYLLGITHVDPLRYNLPLERFITPDRISTGHLPDIDQDLPRADRDLLVNPETGYLKERFGDHFAAISTDSTLKIRNAVKDVARAMHGSVPPDVEVLTKKFEQAPVGVKEYDFIMGYESDNEGHIPGAIEIDPALQEYIKRYPQDWEKVKLSLGLTRQKSRHASAFVIADRPIHEFIPLTTVTGVRCTAYTMKAVEAVGGIKNDYLGLNTLSDISECITLIHERSDIKIPEEITINNKKVPGYRLIPFNGTFYDIWDLPEDQAVFEDVALGRTETVFQYNTPSVVRWLSHFAHKKDNGHYGIDSIDSMAILTALDRPGPLEKFVKNPDTGEPHNMLVEYARRDRGANPSPEVPEIFDKLIPETHSCLVFQEQVQLVYQKLTGCSGPEAENFRRDVGKKEKQKLEAVYSSFMEKASLSVGKENAQKIWETIIPFSAYGFCKAHAYEYAITGYACAFLKHYYPLEWWCSVLRNAEKNEINEDFWRYAGHLIDLPDIKYSNLNWEIQGKRLRAPLSLLKGVGEGAHVQINKYGPYADIKDFCLKMERHKFDNGTIEEVVKLIKDSSVKVINPKTGRKIAQEIEVKVNQLNKAHSSVNRGVVQKLIFTGTLDSLFPEGMHIGDQLNAYEIALAEASNQLTLEFHAKLGDPQKPKLIKPDPVDPTTWDIGPLKRYQLIKGILPAYGRDLRQFSSYIENKMPSIKGYTAEFINYHGYPVEIDLSSAADVIRFQHDMDETGYIAALCYLDIVEVGKFIKDGETKEKCKIVFDIEGTKFEFMRWPDKNNKIPMMYKENIAGAVAMVVLERYKAGKNMKIEDLKIIEKPLEQKKD